MNVIKLESFLATVDCGTVSAAALKLNIGQPAVSKHLNALEADFGVALFDRSSRRSTLSPQGVKVLHVARLVVRAMKTWASTGEGNDGQIMQIPRIGHGAILRDN